MGTNAHEAPAGNVKKHLGSCHCGAVKFEVEMDASKGSRCNCTICTKVGVIGAIVKPGAFRLLSGEENVSTYVWGGKISTRYFCKTCGIHAFAKGHLEQLGGDYVSINLNCLDDADPKDAKLVYWDGRHNNWAAGPRETAWAIGFA